MPSMTNNVVQFWDVQPKTMRRRGVTHTPRNTEGTFNARIVSREIRIFGTFTNHVNGPQEFDKVFRVGDVAEYGSYNLIYTGRILAIGPNTVTVDRTGTLATSPPVWPVYAFIRRNWNFDSGERVEKHNHEEARCI
jgi:hypothetical protein